MHANTATSPRLPAPPALRPADMQQAARASRRHVLALLLVACTACGSLPARDLVALEVVDRKAGQPLPVHRHRGQGWIPGTPGHRYSLRLRNTTGAPLLVVVSVDGVNVVTGETASADQTGYVLTPWQVADIAGWRKSDQEVAEFVFAALPDSYAVRTGRPHDVGTIGIAVFREARPLPAPAVAHSAGSNAEAPADGAGADASRSRVARESAAAMPSSIGTGHGARAWSPITRTTFERASAIPDQVRQWRYDDGNRLAALGIVPRGLRPRRPDAFPGGYVPDAPY